MKVFWSVLVERQVDGEVFGYMMDVAGQNALHGFLRIPHTYARTDMARNNIVKIFQKHSTGADDILVMLDNDHLMERNVVVKLTDQIDAEHQVVGALAFRRSEPYDPCYFIRSADGKGLDVPMRLNVGLAKCLCVGTGAIAIRRSVFDTLEAQGMHWPYFRYSYNEENEMQRSEDFEFALLCERAGISHWVDTTFYIPHMGRHWIGPDDFAAVIKAYENEPDKVNTRYSRIGLSFSRIGSDSGINAEHAEVVSDR